MISGHRGVAEWFRQKALNLLTGVQFPPPLPKENTMGALQDRKKLLDEVAGWSDPTAKIPTNVTGSPPEKPVANMALDQSQKAADQALKQMGQ